MSFILQLAEMFVLCCRWEPTMHAKKTKESWQVKWGSCWGGWNCTVLLLALCLREQLLLLLLTSFSALSAQTGSSFFWIPNSVCAARSCHRSWAMPSWYSLCLFITRGGTAGWIISDDDHGNEKRKWQRIPFMLTDIVLFSPGVNELEWEYGSWSKNAPSFSDSNTIQTCCDCLFDTNSTHQVYWRTK